MALRDTALNILIRARDLATKPIRGTGRALESLNSTAAKVGAAIATYFSARTVIRFFSGAVGEARAFETQMARVQAISGATGEALKQLSDTAEEMGRTTSFTAVEAAQGLELLARAGLSAEDSVGTLPSVLALARGNALELADAASLITSATAAMGLGFEESGRTADVLAKAAASANTTVEELGTALSYAGPVAASMGLSLEETAAIIGRFSDAGIRGTRAGTALAGILVRMQDPASAAAKEMAKLGISTEDPIEAIRQLAAMGDRAGPAILAFGQRAGPALRALLQQGTDGVDELIAALNDAGGAAQAQAEIMEDNLGGALAGLGSIWDSLRKQLMDPLLEPLKREVKDLTGALRDLADSPAFERFKTSLVTAFENAAAGVRRFFGEFDTDRLLDRLGTFAEGVGEKFAQVQRALLMAWNGARIFFQGFAAGVKIIGGLLASAVKLIAQYYEQLFSLFGLFDNAISRAARRVADAAETIRDAFAESLMESIEGVRQGFDGFARAATMTVEPVRRTADALEAVEEKAGLTADELERLGEGVEYVDGEIRELRDATGRIADVAGEIGRLRAEYLRLRNSGTASLQEVGEALTQYRDAVRRAKGETGGLSAELQGLDSKRVRDVSRAFDDLVRQIRGGEKALDFLDIAKMALDAEVALDTGDLETASELAEQAADGIRAMVEAGERTHGLEGMARRLQRVAEEAERAKEAAEADAARVEIAVDGQAAVEAAEFGRHIMEERLTENPPRASLALDLHEADREVDDFRRRLQSEPVTIPVRIEPIGGGMGDDLAREAAKRGRP
jgi:TP901 family phage tail tape measure protein